MELQRASEILQALADGSDPFTDETLPAKSPYQQADTVRALHLALIALETQAARQKRKRHLPQRAGQPWNAEESQILAERFDGNIPINEIARLHQRTRGAIAAQLIKLGKINHRNEVLSP